MIHQASDTLSAYPLKRKPGIQIFDVQCPYSDAGDQLQPRLQSRSALAHPVGSAEATDVASPCQVSSQTLLELPCIDVLLLDQGPEIDREA